MPVWMNALLTFFVSAVLTAVAAASGIVGGTLLARYGWAGFIGGLVGLVNWWRKPPTGMLK